MRRFSHFQFGSREFARLEWSSAIKPCLTTEAKRNHSAANLSSTKSEEKL